MQIVFSDVLIRYRYLIFVCMELSRYLYQKANAFRNGDEEIRTLDPLLARQVLSQLSYVPVLYYNQPS